MNKKALITGLFGQDGTYLAELLISKDYVVHGLDVNIPDVPHWTSLQGDLIDASRLTWHTCDMVDLNRLRSLIDAIEPDECYHLAARSFVGTASYRDVDTLTCNIISTANLLSAIGMSSAQTRLFFAGSSEMFGRVAREPQDENTPLSPRTAYGISKTASYHLCRIAREEENTFMACGFLYNHESPRRGPNFVTRKITRAVASISRGLQSYVELGDLKARRDWGYAPEYVEAMWRMLQHDRPEDFVIATGVHHSVEDVCRVAFTHAGLDWRVHVKLDPSLVRHDEHVVLCGNPSKAELVLGWKARTSFDDLIRRMVDADIAALDGGA